MCKNSHRYLVLKAGSRINKHWSEMYNVACIMGTTVPAPGPLDTLGSVIILQRRGSSRVADKCFQTTLPAVASNKKVLNWKSWPVSDCLIPTYSIQDTSKKAYIYNQWPVLPEFPVWRALQAWAWRSNKGRPEGFIMRGCEEIYLENMFLTDGIDMPGVILLRAISSCNIHLLLQGTLNIITCGRDNCWYSGSYKKYKLSAVLFLWDTD